MLNIIKSVNFISNVLFQKIAILQLHGGIFGLIPSPTPLPFTHAPMHRKLQFRLVLSFKHFVIYDPSPAQEFLMTLRWGGRWEGGVWIFFGATQLLSNSSDFNPLRLCMVADG